MSKSRAFSNGSVTVRKRGGRAEARGGKNKIQASEMADRIIHNMENPRKPYRPRVPSKQELEHMVQQAQACVLNHPDSVAAKRRLTLLVEAYRKLYG